MMGGFGFGDFSRQAQRLAAAAQQARYNNEVRKPSSFTCLHLHIEWQLSEALQQILRSPTALAVLLVEHAYSSLFFDSILARHVAGARRNGPTRFGVWFAAPSRYTPPVSHRTPYHRRSQRRRHKPPPLCKVLFPFHWVCCLPVPQFLC